MSLASEAAYRWRALDSVFFFWAAEVDTGEGSWNDKKESEGQLSVQIITAFHDRYNI